MATDMIVNFSDARERQNLFDALRRLVGMHRLSLCAHRPRRSDRQNRFYWPCVVQPFGDFLRAQGEPVTDDEAHGMLKAKFLRRPIVNRETDEVIGEAVRSTTDLDTMEFNNYVEQCAAWLAETLGIVVPGPTHYREI